MCPFHIHSFDVLISTRVPIFFKSDCCIDCYLLQIRWMHWLIKWSHQCVHWKWLKKTLKRWKDVVQTKDLTLNASWKKRQSNTKHLRAYALKSRSFLLNDKSYSGLDFFNCGATLLLDLAEKYEIQNLATVTSDALTRNWSVAEIASGHTRSAT